MSLKIKVRDPNGDIDPTSHGWSRVTPDGCPVYVISQNSAEPVVVTVMCERLEIGEPWVGYVVRSLGHAGPERLAGGAVDYIGNDDCPTYVGLQRQLDAYFAENPVV